MQGIALARCRLDQIAVAVGEGVAVHHRRPNHSAFLLRALQALHILLDSVADILHKEDVRRLEDRIKSQVGEHRPVLGLGKDKEVALSCLHRAV